MRLIGLTGTKGVGKDTLASVFVENGFYRAPFAGALKTMLYALCEYQKVPKHTIERAIEGDFKEIPSELFLAGKSMRHAMQTLGTEWGRELIGEDLWLKAWRNHVRGRDKVIVTDVRFPNEALLIRHLGGVIIRVVRPALQTHDTHVSETKIQEIKADVTITNNWPSAEQFQRWAREELTPVMNNFR